MTNDKKGPLSVIGIGAAACLACCAPLLLGFIGSLGIAGLASTLFVGVGGLAIAALAMAAFVVVRNRNTSCAIHDADAPITCTATSDEVPVRIEQLERMRSNLDRIDRTEHGMLLHFPNRPDIETDLRRFMIDEKRCCQFWGFDITTKPGELTLRWDAPPTLDHLVTRLVTFFEGHEPLTADSGLL